MSVSFVFGGIKERGLTSPIVQKRQGGKIFLFLFFFLSFYVQCNGSL